jgi:hypothetical protein
MDNLQLKRSFTIEELGLLESEMLKKRRSKEAAWGLWAGLSFFGAHRFYTGNHLYASIMLTTSALPIVIIFLLATFTSLTGINLFFFWLSIGLLAGSVVWSWIDALFLNQRIEEVNQAQELQIIEKIKANR